MKDFTRRQLIAGAAALTGTTATVAAAPRIEDDPKYQESLRWFIRETNKEAAIGLAVARDWYAAQPDLVTADRMPDDFAALTDGVLPGCETGRFDPTFMNRAQEFARKKALESRRRIVTMPQGK